MRYAIRPLGVGKPPDFRPIEDHWPLKDGETFTVDFNPQNFVLAEDQASLRLRTGAEVEALFLGARRDAVIEAIRAKALALVSAEVSALSTFEMVEFLIELWPHLTNPDSNPSLAYVRAVLLKARQLVTTARSATAEQLDAFDVDSPPGGWPATP